ncbi:XDD3 family exosortase-dependent surface protein [Baaleninema sp.]|uniref:XDD3 family exosortase-dependent surface protein n=1 Tax=Baaleninema sp. TaxID=3101197 RepID=UPI003CFDD27E
MKLFTKTSILTASVVLSSLSLGIAPANAGSMYNGWNYTIDSFNDGYNLGTIGENSNFEFYGMALTEVDDQVYVGINSNLSLDGVSSSYASDKHIGYGDLFFNFSGDNAQQTQADSNFFGVHFATNSDSGAPELGVYTNVTGRNVAKANSGFRHLKHHRNSVSNKGGSASLGDLNQYGDADAYFGNGYDTNYRLPNSIASGTKAGDIALLDGAALSSAGLDFGHFGASGNHTFGFSFDRDLLPDGDFMAHLFAECLNDGVVMAGNLAPYEEEPPTESVPEPTSALALLVVGGLGLLKRREQAA